MKCQVSSAAVESQAELAPHLHGPRVGAARLSLSQMPHGANEVSRVYKMRMLSKVEKSKGNDNSKIINNSYALQQISFFCW